MTGVRARRITIAAAALVGTALVGVLLVRGRKPPSASPKDAIPNSSFVTVEINLDVLRRSGALSALFGDAREQTVTKLCGFDPVDRMHTVVFALPENGDGDFGLAVQADLTEAELVACAGKILESRGATASAEPVKRGSYTVVSPRPADGGAKHPPALAFREGGPYLVGAEDWLNQMIDAVDRPSRGPAAKHAALQQTLAGPVPFAVTATVVLPKTVRDKVKAELADEVVDGQAGSEQGAATMAGVLGVSSVALGIHEEGDQVLAVADLVCEDSAACSAVQKLIWRKQDAWTKDRTLRMVGVAAALDHLEVDSHDGRLEVRAAAPTVMVVRWIKGLLEPGARPATPWPGAGTPLPSSIASSIRARPP